ncbi:Protein of unknown function [Vibrio xiamenensis]|uniref:DUF2909 domain-containing protein n=1 Tax=Vibrio xiamenensis TaxID=861298 RepID=A0A1G8GW00_9VIBR|nr:DUF2909 domain-containing protein [Vibrio xiamenensis]SDH98543.1 Protein of unknown function [Vibrio xiamenensis]
MVSVFKIGLVLLLLFIIYNLARALFLMSKMTEDDTDEKPSMSHYLGRRVLFSALAVLLLIIALFSGFLEPNPRPY